MPNSLMPSRLMPSYLKYALFLCCGVLLGYFLFAITAPSQATSPLSVPPKSNILVDPTEPSPSASHLRKASGVPMPSATAALLADKNSEIKSLKLKLAKLTEGFHTLNANNARGSSATATQTSAMNILSMDDLHRKMEQQFEDQMKFTMIKLEGRRLKDIQDSFEQDTRRNDWSANYETKISEFIQTNDTNSLHFVENLECKSRICKLEITSADVDAWQQLFARMVQQDWYRTVNMVWKPDDDGRLTYYLPRMGEDD